jgi:hypothetical protein
MLNGILQNETYFSCLVIGENVKDVFTYPINARLEVLHFQHTTLPEQ